MPRAKTKDHTHTWLTPMVAKQRALRELRDFPQVEFEKVLKRYLFATVEELKDVMNDESTPVIDAMVVSFLYRTMSEGCMIRFNYLIERILGRYIFRSEAASNEARATFEVIVNEVGKFASARPRLKE